MTIQAGMLPELQIGVETPWPMKREGKQVYAKLIDFVGGLPLQLRATTHGVQNIEWSQISWDHSYIASSTDSRKRSLGLVSTPENFGGTMPWRFQVDSTSVQVNMLSLTNYQVWDTVVLCLLYTKAEEGATSGELVTPGQDGQVLTSREGELVWEEAGGGCDCPEPLQPGPEGTVLSSSQGALKWSRPMFTGFDILSSASGDYVVPETGWHFVICVGGGGGGAGGYGSPGFCCGGSGGGSGLVNYGPLLLAKGQVIPYQTGRGGAGGARNYNGIRSGAGQDGTGSNFGSFITAAGGTGASGAIAAVTNTSSPGVGNDPGGKGSYNFIGQPAAGQKGGTGFPLAPAHLNGAGGYGGYAANTSEKTGLGDGAAGQPGCIIIFRQAPA